MFDVAEARKLMARLREADRNFIVFGASSHRYEFEPRIPEPQLRAWEREHGIELPAEYRAFLTELGNGGAGPFYGGGPLESWGDAAGDLRAPFPHREAWNLPPSRLERPEDFESDEEEDAWNEELDAEYYAPSLLDGAFWICHHGCALRTALVAPNVATFGSTVGPRTRALFLTPMPARGTSRLAIGISIGSSRAWVGEVSS